MIAAAGWSGCAAVASGVLEAIPWPAWPAVVVAASAVLWALLRGALAELGKRLTPGALAYLTTRGILERRALRRYLLEVAARNREVRVPFRPVPFSIERIYVPLRASDEATVEDVDALDAVAQHPRIIVLGTQGAGKSLLLCHLARRAAQEQLDQRTAGTEIDPGPGLDLLRAAIPVIVVLRRFANHDGDLLSYLASVLRRMGVVRAEALLARWLASDRLLLMFDGLDEVAAGQRGRVMGDVQELLDDHKTVRSIITCRTGVYRNDGWSLPGRVHELAEFDDVRIHDFLTACSSELSEPVSPEAILRALRLRPRILALARNPLLLTMVAHLYANDPRFELPRSRAEFYEKTCSVLLRQWHNDLNRHQGDDRHAALCAIALWSHEQQIEDPSPARTASDPGTLDLTEMLAAARPALEARGYDASAMRGMLDEIIERSGLIVKLENPACYQFEHFSFQEYFAASALRADGADLVRRYREAPSVWQEPVRLWCGLVNDASDVIVAVAEHDPVTALECAADARFLSSRLATALVDYGIRLLGDPRHTAAVETALAALVEQGTRGDAAFGRLVDAVGGRDRRPTRDRDARQHAAASALAQSKSVRAARALLDARLRTPAASEALPRLGDIVVPLLSSLARDGDAWAMEALAEVGSPLAADALVHCLERSRLAVGRAAAGSLAVLLAKPDVYEHLQRPGLVPSRTRDFDWVWAPFAAPDSRIARICAATSFHLRAIVSDPTIDPTASSFDPRLLVPLAFVGPTPLPELLAHSEEPAFHELLSALRRLAPPGAATGRGRSELEELAAALPHPADRPPEREPALQVGAAVLRLARTHAPDWARRLECLPPDLRADLVVRLLRHHVCERSRRRRGGAHITTSHWQGFLRSKPYRFEEGLSFRLAVGIAAGLSGLALAAAARSVLAVASSPLPGVAAAASAAVIVIAWLLFVLRRPGSGGEPAAARLVALSPLLRLVQPRPRRAVRRRRSRRVAVAELCERASGPLVLGWAASIVVERWSVLGACVVLAAVAVAQCGAWLLGSSSYAKAANPLRGLQLAPVSAG